MLVRSALLGMVTLVLTAAPGASAHQSDTEPITGLLEVPAGQTAAVTIAALSASDTLEWNWSSATAGGALTADLVWQDAAGAAHRVNSSGLPYGRFEAPDGIAGAKLEWRNGGADNATVTWSYACEAAFWSQPSLFLPAAIPIFLVGAGLAAGRIVDTRAKRKSPRRSGP